MLLGYLPTKISEGNFYSPWLEVGSPYTRISIHVLQRGSFTFCIRLYTSQVASHMCQCLCYDLLEEFWVIHARG